jgi:Holliday junction resolvasome RuvABC endonuclease subunit
MFIIGIDPGTHCGWAVAKGGRIMQSGTWDLSPRRHEGGGMRFLRMRRYLLELLASCGPGGAVAYEEVRRHLGTDAAHVYGGIIAQVTSICEEQGVPYRGIPVGTVKKFATGLGNAKKDQMMAAARALGVDVKDDNEADAVFIALALHRELGDG